jgi:hypothetical protein
MKVDKDFLLELFKIPAMSGKEDEVRKYIKSFLDELGVEYQEDNVGNVFRFEKNKPLLMAHMDTVQDYADTILTNFIKIRGEVLSGYGVIGGDDKCGIYIILEMLRNGYDINFAFTVEEEVGGVGSRFLETNFNKELSSCLYALILDRRGSDDIICQQNSYGTKAFEEKLEEIGKDFGYSPARGTFSDADQVDEYVCSANLSVGYFNPHSKTEFVFIPDLEDAMNYTMTIVEKVNEYYQPEEQWENYWYNGVKHSRKKRQRKSPTTTMYPYQDYYWDEFDKYFDDDFAGANAAIEEEVNNMCVFCGTSKKGDLIYLNSLKEQICFDCARYLVEDLREYVDYPLITDEELKVLQDEFAEQQE